MAFREVSVVQIREALRRWLKGDGERPIAQGVGIDRKTARRYITAAVELGVDRHGGEGQLTDELIGQVLERVRPHRPDGHGEAWRRLLGQEARIKKWVEDDLTVVKIGILLTREGVVVPHRTLARFAVERCGAGRKTTTVRVDDPPPGVELQVDFGRLGLVADGERQRVCWALIFTACYSRHLFVWPTFRQTTEDVIAGFEAAWLYFGGAGLPDMGLHALRHTCAALLIAQGAHPKAIQSHLGHRSITTTLDRYGHLFEDEHDRLAERIDAAYAKVLGEAESREAKRHLPAEAS